MDDSMKMALLGVALAIAITTTMDATGYSTFSALPLIPLTGLLWFLQKFTPREIGLTRGNLAAYGLALAYPVLVLGGMALIAHLAGAVDTGETDWDKAVRNIVLMSTTGIIGTLITEEGFFRGWLWAALKRAGRSDVQVLVWTSLIFTLWHVSAISLDTGFDVPAGEIPIYLVNATLLGLVWGMLRMLSGSIIVPSVCHAVWNGLNYELYAFGERTGALGIEQTHLFGPEVGLVGIVLNLAFAVALWRLFVKPRTESGRG